MLGRAVRAPRVSQFPAVGAMSDYAIIFQVLGAVIALFVIFLTYMSTKTWRWVHVTFMFLVFVASVAFCIPTTHPCAGLTASDYTSCKLSGPCKVMVEIKFSTPQNGKVAYITNFFDRCTGTTTPLPGGNFTPTGFNRVDIQRVLTLPTGSKAAALVAVTTSPTAAASAPLLLGGTTC